MIEIYDGVTVKFCLTDGFDCKFDGQTKPVGHGMDEHRHKVRNVNQTLMGKTSIRDEFPECGSEHGTVRIYR